MSLKYKDDVLVTLKDYKVLCEKQSGCQLKVLHTDGGKEYMGEFDDYLKETISPTKLLPFTHPSRIKKSKELIALL